MKETFEAIVVIIGIILFFFILIGGIFFISSDKQTQLKVVDGEAKVCVSTKASFSFAYNDDCYKITK